MSDGASVDPNQARARLIDHFKRVYQIVAGLSITVACGKLFYGNWTTFWLFCTFFITIVPIFHGGDRSLDVKYLNRQPRQFWERVSYVWDVYMLLITAVLFVIIAQTIPAPVSGFGSNLPAPPANPHTFYGWIAGMLIFDVAVLAIDWMKNKFLLHGPTNLGAYLPWGILNGILAAICFGAAAGVGCLGAEQTARIIVFVAAFARTALDYYFGREFLFP